MVRIVFCVLLWCFTVGYAQDGKPTASVLDIEDPLLPRNEIIALTERLIFLVEQTDQFTLLDRAATAQILQEQGFQQSGCTSGECAVEVGQLLGVQKMISGKIGSVGKYYTISLRIVDVTTGKIEKSASHDIMGTVEDVLLVGLKETVGKLFSTKGASTAKVQKAEPVKQEKSAVSEPKPVVKHEREAKSPEQVAQAKRNVKIVLFGGTALAGAGVSALFMIKKGQAHDRYLAATDQKTMDSEIDSEKKSLIIAAGSAGVAAVALPLAVVSIVKKPTAAPTVSFAPVIGNRVGGLQIRGTF